MSLTRRAIWKIERHLHGELTLGGLAAEFNVSPYHLSHAFAETAGRPLTTYLRARRLTQAAEALATGAPDILALALASGYGSHEAFTRAFKARFGLTPEALRRRGSIEGLAIEPPLDLGPVRSESLAPPGLHEAPPQWFVGMVGRFSLGELQAIPALWQRFSQQWQCIEGGVDRVPLGYGGPIDEEGRFEYGCVVQVLPQATTPRGFERRRQPAARYAVFHHTGHVTTLRGSYRAILDEALPSLGLTRAPLACLERHRASFDPATGEGGVDLWIPVDAEPRGSAAGGAPLQRGSVMR
ncbi:AraC family transcriptional regulator [Schlegelella sp. S2-27]|uniref:AraC family transcriptional regulator n=1 Tax=Caldimonas mangrovi TaxID=2944811 RepID=A0ABT0YVM1_9BURK|nr:helix-turn-helix domain-containing protein [Caldimonas mangrovi]MCM5682454.1 AraC family transcriptional regulator [Caldimonas mangrovi]